MTNLATQPPLATLPIGHEIAGHRIDALIGIGGFGVVYRATDLALNRSVALKEYFPHSMAHRSPDGKIEINAPEDQDTFEAGLYSFMKEARLLAQFDHPSLVKVYSFWEENATAYMSMTFLPGQTLKQVIQNGELDVGEPALKQLLIQLAQALTVMHDHRCYHRDVSPDNVILEPETHRPVLLDFGAARQAIEAHTADFTIVLKPGYAPFEQYAKENPELQQGPWTDVYALGALAYRLIIGEPPPASVERMVYDLTQQLGQSEWTNQYSEAFLAAIDKTLAVKAEERFQNMAELIQALSHTLPQVKTPQSTKIPNDPQKPSTLTKMNPALDAATLFNRALIGISLLGILGIAGWWLWPKGAGLARGLVDPVLPSNLTMNPPQGNSLPTPPELTQSEQEPAVGEKSNKLSSSPVLKRAQLELIATNTRLKIEQDFFNLEITAQQTGHVSLYVQTTDGLLLQMLPNANQPNQTIEAGETIHFPGLRWPLIAAGPAGTNEFLAVFSQTPLPGLMFPTAPYYGYAQILWDGPNLIDQLEHRIQTELGCDLEDCGLRYAAVRAQVVEYN